MRRGERLVQVEVHDVHAEIAGTRFADERVHVGAVHVEQATLGVKNFGDVVDLVFEYAQRVRVGEHQRGDVVIHLGFEGRDVDHAARVRLQILDGVARDGGGGGIGAVRRVGNEHLFAGISLGLVIGARDEQILSILRALRQQAEA